VVHTPFDYREMELHSMAKLWTLGRGKLGPFQPLLGRWVTEADTPMGPVRCTRVLESVLDGHYLRLTARWEFGPKGGGSVYEEIALIGAGEGGQVGFWSFTSDGKRSVGTIADLTDLHPEAVGFEADMPAGRARMAYWPNDAGGFYFVVESKEANGWSRFVEHVYRAEESSTGS
jgi:hypothetical protein